MRTLVDRIFFEHPASVDETYGEHFRFAAWFGLTLIGAGLAAISHAVLPCLFPRTASTTVKRLHTMIANRSRSGALANSAAGAIEDPLAFI